MHRLPRIQFGLRGLLLAALLLPPIIAYQYRYWHHERFWQALDAAKLRRDEALVAWRQTYDLYQSGKAGPPQEQAAQEQYYAARQDVESAYRALKARFGNTDKDLLRALEARRKRSK
jgi:hypothetical protein